MSNLRSIIQTDAAKKQFSLAIPEQLKKHMSVERQLRIILNAMNRNPKLEQCTQASFIEACMVCTQFGVEPDGYHAHLIPYGRTATLVIDYKGWLAIAYRSGKVRSVTAKVIRQGDHFVYSNCDYTPWEFRTDARPDEPGEVIGAFCVIELKDGARHCEVMSEADIQKIKQRSKASGSGPWVTDTDEMRKKTVFKRARKWIPLEPEMRELMVKETAMEMQSVEVVESEEPIDMQSSIMEKLPEISESNVDNED